MGVMTITWQDIYDYLRCPKILAFKVAGLRTRIKPRPPSPTIEPYVIGRVGEQVVETLLPPLTSPESDLSIAEEALSATEEGAPLREDVAREMTRTLFRIRSDLKERLLKKLESVQIQVTDKTVKTLLEKAVAGVQVAALKMRERYGELELLGRAEAKAPLLPSWLEPDFAFKPVDSETTIVVEVKNKAKIGPQDRFQASFYATLGRLGGIAVKEHFTLEEASLVPRALVKTPSSCVLLNVRDGTVMEMPGVEGIISFLRDVWEAKQLGLLGKQPEAERGDFCSRCRWKRLCSHFSTSGPPTATLDELAKPYPLIMAEWMLEHGKNLDLLWWNEYVSSLLHEVVHPYRRMFAEELRKARERGLSPPEALELELYVYEQLRTKVLSKIADHLGLDEQELQTLKSQSAMLTRKDIEAMCRDFKHEFEKWRGIMELLGHDPIKRRYGTIDLFNPWLNRGSVRKYGTLPRLSLIHI